MDSPLDLEAGAPPPDEHLGRLEREVLPADGTSGHGRILPFEGTVNVMYSDAMIGSTKRARVLHEDGKDPIFFLPFEDIYFDFLSRSPTTVRCPLKGDASFWNVHAVGEAEDDVMWTLEDPPRPYVDLFGYGAFVPGKMRIEATPREDEQHQVHLP